MKPILATERLWGQIQIMNRTSLTNFRNKGKVAVEIGRLVQACMSSWIWLDETQSIVKNLKRFNDSDWRALFHVLKANVNCTWLESNVIFFSYKSVIWNIFEVDVFDRIDETQWCILGQANKGRDYRTLVTDSKLRANIAIKEYCFILVY